MNLQTVQRLLRHQDERERGREGNKELLDTFQNQLQTEKKKTVTIYIIIKATVAASRRPCLPLKGEGRCDVEGEWVSGTAVVVVVEANGFPSCSAGLGNRAGEGREPLGW